MKYEKEIKTVGELVEIVKQNETLLAIVKEAEETADNTKGSGSWGTVYSLNPYKGRKRKEHEVEYDVWKYAAEYRWFGCKFSFLELTFTN